MMHTFYIIGGLVFENLFLELIYYLYIRRFDKKLLVSVYCLYLLIIGHCLEYISFWQRENPLKVIFLTNKKSSKG